MSSTIPTQFDTSIVALLNQVDVNGWSTEKKNFFTWRTCENLFKTSSSNPAPRKFSDGPSSDNSPEWTYVLKPMSGVGAGMMLRPFMKKSSPDNKSPIHWGCSLKQGLHANQPFEVMYDYVAREPNLVSTTSLYDFRIPLRDETGFNFPTQPFVNGVYLGVSFGAFLLLFANGMEPMFFSFASGAFNVAARFTGFDTSSLFSPSAKYLSIKVEPVMNGILVTTSAAPNNPWYIPPGMSGTTMAPYYVEGDFYVFGGNVQASFAFRPLQYQPTGNFITPPEEYTIESGSTPTCSASLKGSGEIEQITSYAASGGSTAAQNYQAAQVNLVETATINGKAVSGIAQNPGGTGAGDIALALNPAPSQDPNNPNQSFTNTVSMRAGSVQQVQPTSTTQPGSPSYGTGNYGTKGSGTGYSVENGRSPYIWLIRCEVPTNHMGVAPQYLDISQDVMSVDMQWNATSYNEMAYNGSIRVLNRRTNDPLRKIDYRTYMNRSVYLIVKAWWEFGKGYDPQGDNRQVFTGMTVGATSDVQADREVITFQVEDYMNVLAGSKFVLSPHYDGMFASLAVRDIVQQTGFTGGITADGGPIPDGGIANDFGLPMINPIQEPQFRFADGSAYKDAILRIAKLDAKTIFFDRKGDFHYDTMPGGVFADEGVNPVCDFYSVKDAANDDESKLVWNMISFSRKINDAYNVIQVLGVDKQLLARISGASAYGAGITDPNATGYLGFRKHLMISEPALGDPSALFRYLDNYRRRVFIPPLTARFETYGRSNLQPLDIITIDGDYLRIMNISSHIDASENKYWMTIDGEWYFATEKGQDPDLNALAVVTPSDYSPGQ